MLDKILANHDVINDKSILNKVPLIMINDVRENLSQSITNDFRDAFVNSVRSRTRSELSDRAWTSSFDQSQSNSINFLQ